MLSWAIQTSIVSIILIFLVHHLIQFFRDTLTIPKVKDLVNAPKQKYENMFFVMNNKNLQDSIIIDSNFDDNYKKSLLPSQNIGLDMKTELKNYLKSQNQKETTTLDSNKPKVKITDLL